MSSSDSTPGIATPVSTRNAETGESSPALGQSGVTTPLEDTTEGDAGADQSDDVDFSHLMSAKSVQENKELEVFRREWQAEVQRRRNEQAAPLPGPSTLRSASSQPRSDAAIGSHESTNEARLDEWEDARPHSPDRIRHLLQLAEEQRAAAASADSGAEGNTNDHQNIPRSLRARPVSRFNQDAPVNASPATQSQIKAAVKAYATAVERERKGDLDGAVIYYRKAFRIDAAPDRLYERAHAMLKQSEGRTAHQAQSSSSTDPMEKHRDVLLASAEVADMVRKATDFEDHRAEAIESVRKVAADGKGAKKNVRDGKQKAGQSQQEKRTTARLQDSSTSDYIEPTETRDDLDAIILKATEAPEEGRDFNHLVFTSPPPSISVARRREANGNVETGEANQLADDLRDVNITDDHQNDVSAENAPSEATEEDDTPPPPIAKLPEEILAHICELVVEPRGRRAAKIKLPRAEHGHPAQNQIGGKQQPSKGHKAVPGKASGNQETAATAVHDRGDQSHQDKKPAKLPPASASVASLASKPASSTLGVGVVLAGADWQSLEMLGRTCWKWRLITRNRAIWRRILHETYHDPQLQLAEPPPLVANPRLTFIHHPRLRLTGCYIAACHYSRPGLSVDNAWVRVIHLVEFYRSIRFLPDGRALTLLTTDQPKETVGKMHASNIDKGFAVGRWRVEWPPHDDEQDASKKNVTGARVIIDDLRDRSLAKYAFRMILSLRSTSRGKWNKMEMLDYCSINLETGEVLPLPPKHSRPFHFSAVRSYGV
ncbi:unnamed protein product [Sympodiomycopsis kandeliae]